MNCTKFIRVFSAWAITFFISSASFADETLNAEEALINWGVMKLSSWAPPGVNYIKDAKESEEEATTRYNNIVRDAVSVVFDPEEAPLFSGPFGRIRTLALLLSTARSESSFRKDVDFGVGPLSRGDGGQSWCLMQVRLGNAPSGKTRLRISLTKDSITFTNNMSDIGGEDLVRDRKTCFRVGLHIMRTSFNTCGKLPVEERLSAYTAGNCKYGRASSRRRVGVAMKWLNASPAPFNDEDVFKHLNRGEIL
jgi:hypothetical protein